MNTLDEALGGENGLRGLTVIGGGRVGRSLVEQLRRTYSKMALRLVDLRADELAERYQDQLAGVEMWQADLSDDRALAAALSGDVVINTAGPFFRYGTQVLAATIEAGKHYVDVCDESRPLEAMRALDPVANKKGVLAVVGCGFSPGFPNMVVGNLVRSGFKARNVEIAWCSSMADPVGQAAALHALHIVRSPARHLEGGMLIDVEPLRNHRVVDFPEPFGVQQTFDVEHSEPVTLSTAYDGLDSVWVGGAILPAVAIRRLKAYAELGLTEPSALRIGEMDVTRASIVGALDRSYWSGRELPADLPGMGAVVVTVTDPSGMSHRYGFTGQMAQSTAAGAMAGLVALMRHSTGKQRGVLFSEEAIDWREYQAAAMAIGGKFYQATDKGWDELAIDAPLR